MPWYRTADGQNVHHVLIRGKVPLACAAPRFKDDNPAHGEACGRMGGKLCDAPEGKDLAGKPLTCDMSLCKLHATEIGPNRDVCPRHARRMRERGQLVDGSTT